MKKIGLFAAVLALGIFIMGCDGGESGGGAAKFYQSKINGKVLAIYLQNNFDNASNVDHQTYYFVSGESFDISSTFFDPAARKYEDNHPDLANVKWSVGGDIGYFNSNIGKDVTFTAGIPGKSGSISVEVNGFRTVFPVKIFASQNELRTI